jgi:hypothetical protein
MLGYLGPFSAEQRFRSDADRGQRLEKETPRLHALIRRGLLALKPACLTRPPERLPTRRHGESSLEFAKEMARLVASRYGMELPLVAIRFASAHSHAGCVRRVRGQYLIDLATQLADEDDCIAAVVAHEMAHVLMMERGVRISPDNLNEEVTDTIAVMAGFGASLVRASYNVRHRGILGGIVGYSQIGYLAPTALTYLALLQAHRAGISWLGRRRVRSELFLFVREPNKLLAKRRRIVRRLHRSGAPSLWCVYCDTPLAALGQNRVVDCRECGLVDCTR